MDARLPDVVVPAEPGLHLMVDRPQGAGNPLLIAFASHALAQGLPVVAVLLDQATPQFRAALNRHGTDADAAAQAGHLVYVDAFSSRVGWAHTDPATIFVEDRGPDALLLGLSEAQAGIVEQAPDHLVLVDSLSTMLVLDGLPETYAFAQTLSSLAPRLGSISVARLVAGMHDEQQRTSILHLANTVTDLSERPATSTSVRGAETERT